MLHSRANILIDNKKDISNDQILLGFIQAVEYFLNERFLFIGVFAELFISALGLRLISSEYWMPTMVSSVNTLTTKNCMF